MAAIVEDCRQCTDISVLALAWGIKPVRILTGAFETSLNAPGLSISLCNLSAASRETGISVKELLDLLDAPTTAVSWPNVTGPRQESGANPKAPEENVGSARAADGVDIVGEYPMTSSLEPGTNLKADLECTVDAKLLSNVIRSGCEAAIAAEPNLTKWDMVMGDGDCGEAVKGVSEGIVALFTIQIPFWHRTQR